MKKTFTLTLACLLMLGSLTYHQKADASIKSSVKIFAKLSITAIVAYGLIKLFANSGNKNISKGAKKKAKNIIKTVDDTFSSLNKNVKKNFGIDVVGFLKKCKNTATGTWKKFKKNVKKNQKFDINKNLKKAKKKIKKAAKKATPVIKKNIKVLKKESQKFIKNLTKELKTNIN